MPVTAARYRPAPRLPDLGGQFFDAVEAARFPHHTLRFRNQRWAARIGLGDLTDGEWEGAFARFEPLPDNLRAPLAMRYHGHQFRVYNPALGDGRGFLYAQVVDDGGRLLDLATKGSGQTPWSRGGDGRLTLKGGVREVLATEMLEALGVYTSKSFSLIETGESLQRNDEPSPTRSSVLVRLGHSHIRFGSFQRHYHLDDWPSLRALVQFCLDEYAPELCCTGDLAVPMLLRLITERSARLCAQWMAAGFVHGVLNTDNMNVTGESFDYGPYRFLPVFDPAFTAAYFDHGGLYAYGNQPAAVQWNLDQLARALAPISTDAAVRDAVAPFEDAYARELERATLRRLGVAPRGRLFDGLLTASTYALMHATQIRFEQVFFDWYGGPASEGRALAGPAKALYDSPAGRQFRHDIADYEPRDASAVERAYFGDDAPCTLLIDEIESIWADIADRDDWRGFDAKIAAIRRMGEALAG